MSVSSALSVVFITLFRITFSTAAGGAIFQRGQHLLLRDLLRIWPLRQGVFPPNAETTFTDTFSPTTPGTRTATIQIASNDPDENPFVIQLTGRQATPIDIWRKAHFGSFSSTGPGADLNDVDRDGVAKMMEFATGSDPLVRTLPIGQLVKNGNTLEFSCRRPKAALAEVCYDLEDKRHDFRHPGYGEPGGNDSER